jgi:hypothetical protein
MKREKSPVIDGSLTTLLLTGQPMDGSYIEATHADKAKNSGTKNRKLGGNPNSEALAGLYRRASSHPARYDEKRAEWLEVKVKSFDKEGIGLGINIPLGGVGNSGPCGATIGPEGAWKQGRDKGNHGSILFISHDHPTGGEHLMIGHEGSGPGANSQVGAHDLASMLKAGGNERSLTGQFKGSFYGVPSGLGAIKAWVTEKDMQNLARCFAALEGPKFTGSEQEKEFFRKLLVSTKHQTRRKLIKHYLGVAAK